MPVCRVRGLPKSCSRNRRHNQLEISGGRSRRYQKGSPGHHRGRGSHHWLNNNHRLLKPQVKLHYTLGGDERGGQVKLKKKFSAFTAP